MNKRNRILAAALGLVATAGAFVAFAQTGAPLEWKSLRGKVVITGTIDVDRTNKEFAPDAEKPEAVYFHGKDGKTYKYPYSSLDDACKNRVDVALGLTAAQVVDSAEETSSAGKRRLVAEPKDGKLPSPSGFKAFLVGADDYREATNLAFVKNDVEALAARLIELGFEEKNVATLKTGGDFGDYPTKENIEDRFAAFIESLRPGDFAVVYLSGHGIQPTNSKEAFFAPVDVKASDPFGTAVSIDKMLTALDSSAANFRWMIVDACRDDPTNAKAIFNSKSATGAKGLVEIASAPTSTSLLQSCQPGRVSYEGGGGVEHGVFTMSLLEALDKNNPRADADKDGALAFSEVFKYVTERTNELALEHHGATQTPNWTGRITDFAILSGLLRDGLTQARWLEADKLYREARALRRKREYRQAAEKMAEARRINAANEEYKAEEAEIAEMLRLETKAQEATTAQAEAERKAKAEAEARAAAEKAKAEAVRRTRNSDSSTGRTSTASSSEASGDWSGSYEAGTAKSLNIRGVKYTFRYCPAGTFTMGSPQSEYGRSDSETQHKVTLTQGFWLLETEVTQAMWGSVIGENLSHYAPDGDWANITGIDSSNFPAERVSWEDCQEFVDKLNSGGYAPQGLKFRLPTEAEWEYACRAGTKGPYAGPRLDLLGWYRGNSPSGIYNAGVRNVGEKRANAWGLYDMHGNVFEWCSDWYGAYDASSQTDPTGPTEGSKRVLRGGNCIAPDALCRSAARFFGDPTDRIPYQGVRIVLGREL